MNDSNLPPEQWRTLFDAAGVEFGYRPLATRIGMNHTRVRRLLRGGGTTAEAIQLVADALHVPPSKVRELRGEPASEFEPFILPDDAGRLNDRERDAVRAIVRVLLDARDAHHADQSDTDTDSSTSSGAQTQAGPPQEDESLDDGEVGTAAGVDAAAAAVLDADTELDVDGVVDDEEQPG